MEETDVPVAIVGAIIIVVLIVLLVANFVPLYIPTSLIAPYEKAPRTLLSYRLFDVIFLVFLVFAAIAGVAALFRPMEGGGEA
jgi:multisubunit Na+/H+ antiporter MnhB subunit